MDWKRALLNVKGVYLIVDKSNGKNMLVQHMVNKEFGRDGKTMYIQGMVGMKGYHY